MKRNERAHSNTFMLLAASMNRRTQTIGPCSIKQAPVVVRRWESDDESNAEERIKAGVVIDGCAHTNKFMLEWRAETTRIKEVLLQTNSCYQPLHQ